ncbi:translocation and assembly module TamB [Erwinia sp. OLTSP20]|uniref:autotransporter assembly complex protein TamB n=1 Tax=unclassified Erwinia TaxID=2622719 RepID=UPI000C19BA04|nr:MULTISPECIES: translocation/assembly module TamB domain-containing protein [unclassified Erwinia]PIJ52051.1 translocation and assembly module TamB [Erwinia sp. OAMSP11]PIJ75214.1 translocation and assembly module TamB [Erwinia sp. OLSSP12]PIJ84421.1 translocation and assembly module TamB [Erwinia sp. OLCASP19]PIJ87035.1 translocation and assembly module TamB [Erwinia sp. OLMTSP26]PIJ88598.1 translocation and assembly module TamB [Erwinia sp. OLMDSP33]
MRRWKKALIGVMIFLLLLLAGFAFLIGTAPGLHLLFNAAGRWVPGFSVENVKGGWRDLTVSNLRYEMPGVTTSVGRFHLALNLGCLKHSAFCINDLSLSDVDISVDSKKLAPAAPAAPEAEEETQSAGEISTPWPLTLTRLALHNVNVKVDETAISLADFSIGMAWQGRSLTLTPGHLQSLLVSLPKNAAAPPPEKKDPNATPLGEQLNALFAGPLLPPLPDFRLPLDIDVQQILAEQLRVTGGSDLAINRLEIKARTSERHLQLTTLDVDSSMGQVNASGEAELSGDWPLNLTLNSILNMAPLKGEKLKLVLSGAMRKQTRLALNLSGPLAATLQGQTELATPGLPLTLALNSPHLRWPLSGQAQYQVDHFAFNFTGKATDYRMALKAAVNGAGLPPANVNLDGKGNLNQFALDKLHVAVLQGSVDLKALVDWSKSISWRSELTLNNINTAKHYPDWPAKLDGKMTTRGSLYGDSWQLRMPELALKGNVKQNAVKVQGSLYGNSYNQWDIPGISIALGANHIDVKGSLKQTLALDAIINAPRLDNALPGLGGHAEGTLKARGSLQKPQLLANLSARNLRWQQLNIAGIKLDGDVTSGDQIQGKLALHIGQIKQDALEISELNLEAQGNEKQHRLNLSVKGQPVSGQLALNGHFDRHAERWSGTLNNTFFNTPVGEWRLTRAIALDYLNKKQTVSIGPHCWLNPDAELCVPQTIEAGPAGHARIDLKRFDLAMLKPFLSEDTRLAGVFNGSANLSWTADGGLPQGQVSLKGNGVKVTQNVQGNQLPVAFDTLNLNAALRNNRAQLDWLIHIANNGQLTGNLQITDPQGRRQLGGNVNIQNLSLALLNPALAKGESISGTLNSQLRLGGNLQRPQVFGQLALRDARVDASVMPVDLRNANITMQFNGMRSTLEGLLQTAKGQLNLNGDADWSNLAAWRARVAAKGDRIRVIVPPMVRMDVSPDLVFEATPDLLNLNGRVDIPWARISVQDVPPSAVGVSSDEVLLDEHLQPVAPKTTAIPINSNLIIHVGNDVRLNAFGLKAKLNRDLKLVQDRRGLGLNGQINIPDGRFRAYGQDLIIRKGELQFAGPPDQPYLNIEAIRNPEATENDVVAGLRVTGLADQPKAEVFSDPAMSQQEALSYLLRGQGLDSSGGDGAVTSALLGLGVAQTGQVMGKIGETFGVSNLALDTTGVGDSQQVQVSGYVLPGLQVKYGVGIFDSLATLTLRYRLMPKLYLEAVSGLDQALDVLYQFEF